jgi:4-hydroxy-tetrahydrodipicolinate synthase
MKNTALQVQEFKGCYVPLITPMDSKEEVDYKKLECLVEDCLAAEVDGFVACGTTGQSATLAPEEHVEVAERIFKCLHGRSKLIVNAGSNSTREAIHLSRAVEERIGPTTFLHVTGYYNCPPQPGLVKHFSTVAESLRYDESNIILYNVPSRTTSNITADTAVTLSKHPRIIGIKEASGNVEQVGIIIQRTDPNSFRVVSGEDKQTVKIVELGGFGVISACANISPLFFARMTHAALEAKKHKDYAEAYAMQNHINPLVDAVFCAKNPIPLAMMFNTNVRLPLCLIEEVRPQIEMALARYKGAQELGIDAGKYRRM